MASTMNSINVVDPNFMAHMDRKTDSLLTKPLKRSMYVANKK